MSSSENLKIGVSGLRGVVGDTLTPELILNFAQAFGTYLNGGTVVVGRDTRPTGIMIKYSIFSGLISSGCKIVDLDICPTPTVLMMVKELKAAGGIVITASHNPLQWNGLKFVKNTGMFLNPDENNKLLQIYSDKNNFKNNEWAKLGNLIKSSKNPEKTHFGKIFKHVDKKAIRKAKLKVAFDCVNGAGSVFTPLFLKELGCRLIPINTKPDGIFPHTPEPVPENLKDLCKLVKSKKADIGFAQDPDADRLAIVDENGNPIGEEYTLALVLDYILSKKRSSKVVLNLSTSRASEDVAKKHDCEVIRTKVGEANVAEGMIEHNALIGGEGNGGVIYPAINFCRDSFVGMAFVLSYLAESKKKLSEIIKTLPQYKIVKAKFELPKSKIEIALKTVKEKYRNEKITTIDGIKIDWNDSWAHIRASNTEPVIRIAAEARTNEQAEQIVEKICREII
ncbi:MAG: phosphoglucosamine mutase [Elusimicrobia bacterium]|nr:phosphoglucosamine mutase [Elusimicrobiota bacterium]MBU2614303.1 phosphoglucosamine mutase [Elusimicrobiota bacterium]